MIDQRGTFEKILDGIRSADDVSKKRWLVASSVVVGLFVVFLWVINFGMIVSNASNPAALADTGVQDNSPSFFATVLNGFNSMGGALWRGVHSLGNALNTPREDLITPK